MEFVYVGDEAETTIFGLTFKRGEAVEVADAHAIRKLKHSALFTHNAQKSAAPTVEDQPKRRGRPPRVTDAKN